jgi:hypothetical protein
MTRFGRALRVASVAGALILGAIAIPATAGQAAASICSNGEHRSGWSAHCVKHTNPVKDGEPAIAFGWKTPVAT